MYKSNGISHKRVFLFSGKICKSKSNLFPANHCSHGYILHTLSILKSYLPKFWHARIDLVLPTLLLPKHEYSVTSRKYRNTSILFPSRV